MTKQNDRQQSSANRGQQAVIYMRTATAHPADQPVDQVARQREGCQRIADRYGLRVIREYADIGRPARLEQQTELMRLLDDLRMRQDAAFVVVWDYARLGRSMEQLGEVGWRIQQCDAQIATITGVEVADRPQYQSVAAYMTASRLIMEEG